MPVQIDIDMPENCPNCPYAVYIGIEFGDTYIFECAILQRDIRCKDETKRHSKCPLKELK